MKSWVSKLVGVGMGLCVTAQILDAATFATYRSDSPGQYPDVGWLRRPYYVEFKSNIDGATDWFSLFLPANFDPNKIYPVWFKFKPYFGSGSNATGPSHAWNYCDSNQVIVVGCNLRGTGDAWFGDNEGMDPTLRSNLVADVYEILNQLMHMYKISYVAASGASMGGYSSLKFLSKLPQSYVGAAVASCPAIWFRPWVQQGSDALYNQIGAGFFNQKYVMLLHGDADDTVPVQNSRTMTAAAPDKQWWQLVEIPGGGHAEYFCKFDYVNYSYPFDEQYGQCPTVPNIWQQIHAWEAAHASLTTTYRPPLPGWTQPTNWYFPQTFYDARPNKTGGTTNAAPTANAGADQAITLPSTATLNGTASDDGLPSNRLTYAWTKVSGPGTVTFTNTTTLNTRASFSTNGSYVLRLTVNDTALSGSDDLGITVNASSPVNAAPSANAGADQTITLPAAATLGGTASDDGLPSNKLTVAWSKVSGPGTVTFTNATTANTRATFSTNGAYVLRLTANDTILSASDDIAITVNPVPQQPTGVTTVLLQKGVSPGTNFVGCKDSTFRSLYAASFGAQSLGKDPSLDPRWKDVEGAGIIWFDLSSIPTGATIQSATLKMWHEPSEFEDTAGAMLMYPLHDPNGTGMWDENTASDPSQYGTVAVAGCALFKRPSVAWASTGEGRYSEVMSTSEVIRCPHSAGVTGWLSFAVTRDVSLYATNTAKNLGWIFYTETDSTIRGNLYTADSATAAKRPQLVVVYGSTPTNQRPVVNAGVDQAITLPATATLSGTASDDNLPSNILTVAWSKVSGPGTVTFTNTATLNTRASFSSNGAYVLQLVANDGALSATDTIAITVNPAPPVNQAPTANAGADQTITLPSTATLNGAASDDGLPSNKLTVVWTKISGPGTVTFTNAATANTRASFSSNGVYVLRLTASDTALSTSDDIQITVNPAPPVNQAPTANAGADQTITLPSAATLNGTASDDGLPSNRLTYAWAKVSGPGTVTFTNAATLNTLASFSTNGAYVLRLSANDTALSASDDIAITVNAAASTIVTTVLQKGVSPGTNFVGCKDSTFRSLYAASFGAQSLGKDPSLDPRWKDVEGAGIIWFDLSSIPTGATIQSATLKMWHEPSEFEDTAGAMLMYPLHDPNGTGMWDENTASDPSQYGTVTVSGCALFKRPSVAWASTGEGRYSEVMSTSEVIRCPHSAGVTGWLSFAVTRDVSLYATNTAKNLGWIFYTETDSTIRGNLYTADSATAAKRPQLVVVYGGSGGGQPVNQAPTANAGADQTITLPTMAMLSGAASDDGLPSNQLTYAWSKVSGPGSVTFTNATTLNTRVGFGSNGVYVLRLTVSDTALTASDDIQITANTTPPVNQAPTANAGADQAITLPSTATLGGSGSDDGLPSNRLTFAWSKVSGPGTVTFTNATTANSRASFSTNGAYVLRLTANDTILSASDDIAITVNPASSGGGGTTNRIVPPLTDLIAASYFLNPGDIPNDTFTPPASALYVAATGGSDANAGTFAAPFATLDKAINTANANAGTPYTIYLRGGIHTFKGVDPGVTVNRGNLYITAYSNETVTIRPPYYPGNPSDWSNLRCFIAYGPYINVTFDKLIIEGYQIAFEVGGASGTGPAMKNLTIKNIIARGFTHRDGYVGNVRSFLSTAYLADDVYGAGKQILDDPTTAHYQMENVILQNIEVRETDMAINIGDENDANIKGIRISNFNILNPAVGGGESSANDGMAVVNCYKVLIDSCTISNTIDDGIDTKSFDVAVINCYVEGTTRNAVKFWRSGEIINSFMYACTPINDGGFIVKEGPCRVVNSVLMSKYNGYSATLGYDTDPATVGSLEIVNSIFTDLDGPYYVVHNNMTSKNSLYYDMRQGFFQGGVGNINDVGTLNSRAGSSGNITANPLFTNVAGRNFTPQAGSPLVDAGTSSGVLLPTFDFYGRPRIVGSQPDIGPIER